MVLLRDFPSWTIGKPNLAFNLSFDNMCPSGDTFFGIPLTSPHIWLEFSPHFSQKPKLCWDPPRRFHCKAVRFTIVPAVVPCIHIQLDITRPCLLPHWCNVKPTSWPRLPTSYTSFRYCILGHRHPLNLLPLTAGKIAATMLHSDLPLSRVKVFMFALFGGFFTCLAIYMNYELDWSTLLGSATIGTLVTSAKGIDLECRKSSISAAKIFNASKHIYGCIHFIRNVRFL